MMAQLGRKVAYKLQRWVPVDREGLLILTYHLVNGGTTAPVDIPLAWFRSHIHQFAANSRICSLHEALDVLEKKTSLSECLVVLTFDDAYENFYTHAWPVIQELRAPVTLYVPVDFVDKKTTSPLKGFQQLRPCSWQQLREMSADGLVSIGSHSCSHSNLARANSQAARAEVVDSKMRLEDRLGVPVESFCYPGAFHSRSLEPLVRDTYRSAVVGGGKKMRPGHFDPYRLNRVPARSGMPENMNLLLKSSFWLEEVIASRVRQWLA
jgi:peptidoglycan/xylan/chitin deacetylase (PgdA/CDA1 family)